MSTTRFRRAFAYPADNDDVPADGIDEEEQETLIQDIQAHDEDTTAFYTTSFLALPLLSSLAYIPSLLWPSSASSMVAALLSISSLLASAYILYYLPLMNEEQRRIRRGGMRLGKWADDMDGPVNKYLVFLNGGLAGVLGLKGFAEGKKSGWSDTQGLWGVLPLIVFILIVLVRWQLKPVDIEGLQKLRYGYKGA